MAERCVSCWALLPEQCSCRGSRQDDGRPPSNLHQGLQMSAVAHMLKEVTGIFISAGTGLCGHEQRKSQGEDSPAKQRIRLSVPRRNGCSGAWKSGRSSREHRSIGVSLAAISSEPSTIGFVCDGSSRSKTAFSLPGGHAYKDLRVQVLT